MLILASLFPGPSPWSPGNPALLGEVLLDGVRSSLLILVLTKAAGASSTLSTGAAADMPIGQRRTGDEKDFRPGRNLPYGCTAAISVLSSLLASNYQTRETCDGRRLL